jgi:hypothetical protein
MPDAALHSADSSRSGEIVTHAEIPPRVWLKSLELRDRIPYGLSGSATLVATSGHQEPQDVEYLSVKESQAMQSRAREEGRAEAFENGYKEWLKNNPDFEPNNRYDDFYKDAFYCGYGQRMKDDVRAAASRSGEGE